MQLPEHLAHLAAPLSGTCPCGESLEYDADYLVLEGEVQGSPDVEYGSTVTQAVMPDWKRVHALAVALLGRSRDLRLAVYLARAELNLHGIAGLLAGLSVIEALLAEHWQQVHPQLDPDDGNDPQQRVNILAGLCEEAGLLKDLRAAPLVEVAARSGTESARLSLRDLDLAHGEAGTCNELESNALARVEALCQEAGHTALAAVQALLEQACAASQRIEVLLTEHVGFASAIDLSALPSTLRRAAEALRQRLPSPPGTEAPAAQAMAGTGALLGEINSREQVRQVLMRLCAYYAAHEPASPVPLLLQRASRLVEMNFTELLHDLAPDGLDQLARVSGIRDDDH